MSEEYRIRRESIGDAAPIEAEGMVALGLVVGAPVAFLTAQVLRYFLVGPACEIGAARVALELATLIALGGAAAVMWFGWSHAGRRSDGAGDGVRSRRHFIGFVGVLLGALFLLAGIALWVPSLFLSPCGRP